MGVCALQPYANRMSDFGSHRSTRRAATPAPSACVELDTGTAMQQPVHSATQVPVRRNAGLGLIELMVALAIITIAILGMNSLALSMIRGNLSARLNDEATQLAREKFEIIHNAGYSATPAGTTTEMLLNLYKAPAIFFTRQTTVAAGPLSNTRTVTVTMTWTDGAVRRTTFATEIAQ